MGFFEIFLIAIVTLLVVGPERMPEAVRSVALTIGRFKRLFNNAREEVERQVGADEIRQQLHNEAVMENLAKMEQATKQQSILGSDHTIHPSESIAEESTADTVASESTEAPHSPK